MNYWLMKNEPSAFGITDLKKKGFARWDGIRNYQVRNMLRDEFKVGDRALFYHSNAGKETGVVGVMKVVKSAYSDPLQFKASSEYYDSKSSKAAPRWLAVDVAFISVFSKLITLEVLRNDRSLENLTILKRGNRLSVTKITKAEFDRICKLGEG